MSIRDWHWLWLAGASALQASVQAQGAVLRGRVLVDSTKLPIAEATVLLVAPQRAAKTDSLGRFRLAGITPQRHHVLVRRLGFAPFSTDVSFSATDSVDGEFMLTPVAQSLTEVFVPTTTRNATVGQGASPPWAGGFMRGYQMQVVDIVRAAIVGASRDGLSGRN